MVATEETKFYQCNLCHNRIVDGKGFGFKSEPRLCSSELAAAKFHLCYQCLAYLRIYLKGISWLDGYK